MLLKNAGDVVEKKGWVRRRGPALSRQLTVGTLVPVIE